MKVSANDFTLDFIPDDDPDTSYLEQEGFEDRLRQYRDGQFHFIGVRARVELSIPTGESFTIAHTVTSPGLWGIETDSDSDYLEHHVGSEEKETLADMLREMGIEVTD